MILGQTAVAPGQDARRAQAMANNAAIREKFEQNRQIVAGVSAAIAAIQASRDGDFSGAVVAAVSEAQPVLRRTIRIAKQMNAGDYCDAFFNALGFFPKVMPVLAVGNTAKLLIEGKPEAAAMAVARIAAIAVFGPGVLIVEGLINFFKSDAARDTLPPASPGEDRLIALEAFETETLAIVQETAELTEAAEMIEGFRFPGQFIGEGEEVPGNVLALDGATSETGEAGYTPIAAMSLDGEILYDQAYLPWIGGVMRAVAANVAPVAGYSVEQCCLSRFNDCLTPATGPKFFNFYGNYVWTFNEADFSGFLRVHSSYVFNGLEPPSIRDRIKFIPIEGHGAAGEITYDCKQVPIIPVASSLPTVQVLPDAFAPDAGGAGAPYAPDDAPRAPYAPPGKPYIPPGAEGRPYFAPTPATGFNPPSGNLPQLPAGTIVPGTAFDFVEEKKPFPWWLVAAVITLS